MRVELSPAELSHLLIRFANNCFFFVRNGRKLSKETSSSAVVGGYILLDHATNLILSDTQITKDGTVSSSSLKLLSLSHSNHVILYNNSISTNNFDFANAEQAAQSNFYGDVAGAIVAENADSFIEADW